MIKMIGGFPVKQDQWEPNAEKNGYTRKLKNTDVIKSEEILTDIQKGGSLRLRSYQDGGHLQIVKDAYGDLVSINKFVQVTEPGHMPKTEIYKYTELTGRELGLAEKSMIQRSAEYVEERISKKTFDEIKQLYKETQGFTKRFKWVKIK